MSLATRCPACGTVFRVVQDQLKVCDGWVRCGRCSEVFDASKELFDLDAPPPPLEPLPATSAGPWPPAHAAANDEPEPVVQLRAEVPPDAGAAATPAPTPEAEPAVGPDAELTPAASTSAQPGRADGAGAGPKPEPEPEPEPEQAASQPVAADRAEPAPAAPAGGEPEPETPAATPAEVEPAAAPAAPEPLPSFVLRARRSEAARARWRVPLALAAAGLFALLVGQVALQMRDTIAAAWPATRPTLEAACAVLGCKVHAPLRIDDISVETFTLRQIDHGPTYLLQLALRSRAPHDVRMPAIDLTLTDLQGRTVLRRMLDARELGATSERLPPQREVTLQALVDLGELPVVGYSAELFYP